MSSVLAHLTHRIQIGQHAVEVADQCVALLRAEATQQGFFARGGQADDAVVLLPAGGRGGVLDLAQAEWARFEGLVNLTPYWRSESW